MAQKRPPAAVVKGMNSTDKLTSYVSPAQSPKGVGAPAGSKRPSVTVKATPMSKSPQRAAMAASDERAKARERGNPDK